jgi:short subunit dehydrogenase-like uncharacterized protein
MDRDFEIIVYGATGFTGKLVAGHLLKIYGAEGDLKWAIAGRNPAKLDEVRSEIGAPANLPFVIADSSDPASLTAMVRRSKAIITTAGPYQLHGSELVAACAAEGTDYLDITGEPNWISDMLVHEARAKNSGARIVFCCGFDSIPFDLGVYFLQSEAQVRLGSPAARALARLRRLERGIGGGQSGGSLATGMATMAAMRANPQILSLLADPFALTPGFRGPEQPNGSKPYEDAITGSWVVPFMMAATDTKVVHRSNFLLGHPWGKDFKYDEMSTADGPNGSGVGASSFYMVKGNPPKPGEGPSSAEREGGCYDILFIGEAPDGRILCASVRGDMDPGAGSTSRMLGESAVCLVRDISREQTPGGIWTSASAMGDALIGRLAANAGVTFQLEQSSVVFRATQSFRSSPDTPQEKSASRCRPPPRCARPKARARPER